MALRMSGRGPVVARAIEAGVEVMGTLKTAPETGVIRNESGGARRVRKGAPIPAGWTFDNGDADLAVHQRGPSENTQATGPSEAWTRGDLNDYAAKLGIETPEQLGNKAEVLAAIQARAEATPPDVVAEAGTVIDRRTERRQS